MSTLFLQMVEGLTPVRVAVWMLTPSIAMIIVGNLAAASARKVRPTYVLAAAAMLAATGILVITQVSSSAGPATLLTGLTVAFVGGGMVGILSATLIMSSAPSERPGRLDRCRERWANSELHSGSPSSGSSGPPSTAPR